MHNMRTFISTTMSLTMPVLLILCDVIMLILSFRIGTIYTLYEYNFIWILAEVLFWLSPFALALNNHKRFRLSALLISIYACCFAAGYLLVVLNIDLASTLGRYILHVILDPPHLLLSYCGIGSWGEIINTFPVGLITYVTYGVVFSSVRFNNENVVSEKYMEK